MRQDGTPNTEKQTIPLWVGKHSFCVLTGRSPRTIDNWMASGSLHYRKFPSGMVRLRASDANQEIGVGGLKQKNVHHLAIVSDSITATDLAAIHDVSVDTVREWVAQGIAPHYKNPAGTVSFDPKAVEEAFGRFDVSLAQDVDCGQEGRTL